MARMVQCKKLNKELEGLNNAPFPGPKGLAIYETISKQAWEEWLTHQTRLINEKHLNMMDMTARTYLNEQRDKFLAGEDVDEADGYVPPSK